MEDKSFTPALGYSVLTPLYDFAIATLTREEVWRSKLVTCVAPKAGERILDVGCGTGSLAIRLKELSFLTQVVGLDPDPSVLGVARKKAEEKHLEIDWREGFLKPETVSDVKPVSKVVSSLVFHQTPVKEKQNILSQMHDVLETGGELFIADYGWQRTKMMRFLFRASVQQLDGMSDTQPNADGVLPRLIEDTGFIQIEELEVVPTPTGSISIYSGIKAM